MPPDAHLLALHRDGQTYADIAAALGLSVTGVRGRISRQRRKSASLAAPAPTFHAPALLSTKPAPALTDLTALLRDYRAACYANGINPATGNPARCDNPHWWMDVSLWQEVGPNHSPTEAAALASIAAQARAAQGGARTTVTTTEAHELIREVFAELRGVDLKPLREMHAARGVTVEEVLGQRMEVPLKRRIT